MTATAIKTQLKTLLDELKTAETLGTVIVDDFREDPLTKDIPAYPCAILGSPSATGSVITNRDNVRSYQFEIAIIMKGEAISTNSAVETLMDAVMDKLDNDPTLGGTANSGIEPTASTPFAITSGDKSFIIFTIAITAKVIRSLTY